MCGTPHSIRTVILEELILQNLREIVSFARSHENRFVQMVMDMDVKERNKGLAKKRKLLSEGEKRITELDMIFKRLYVTTFQMHWLASRISIFSALSSISFRNSSNVRKK